MVKDCPNKKEKNWRTIPPDSSKNEAKEKVVNGVTYKWCGKCRSNKGFWNGGDKAHFTHKHQGKNSETNSTNNESANQLETPQANIGYIDEPLEFGFFGSIANPEDIWCKDCKRDHPKGLCGKY